MKKQIFLLISITILSILGLNAQENTSLSTKLKTLTKKGDYVILEVRLNNEDEFRTIEGSETSLTRISIFTGTNSGSEIIRKGFDGINTIVFILNDLKTNGWILNNVYSIKGESLIITHYVLERKK
ncbi:MAG: hypothetical protein COW67_02365 [Flavobacteriales bacterium CG18_big_fil_WC_8_21_14_2_50_32_9]|nr:hypothetical protein [Flavobacteriales bacterium]NCT16141.1 hypothetical protein [Flavobacteriales bacterium]PIQ16538.1 MAG: hypothetical protein COW67_02365 [Flavobacteriales bacterium CG18_big_fil_WC_8_21_14_2_50_32_9]PJC61711.1 MAG: hypothetical protein CO022_08345 [Flavobacteriales bacterium CG_4_9_14_0_2_um_filter_32_27]